MMGTAEADAVGIYNVIGQLVLPTVAYLLGDPEYAQLPTADPNFNGLPSPVSGDADHMLGRLYAVLDTWAASPYVYFRNAMFIEFVESGYSSLTVDDLLRYAGPALRKMAGE